MTPSPWGSKKRGPDRFVCAEGHRVAWVSPYPSGNGLILCHPGGDGARCPATIAALLVKVPGGAPRQDLSYPELEDLALSLGLVTRVA